MPKTEHTSQVAETKPTQSLVSKMPTGNLAPSKKDSVSLVKKVSAKVASVFGSDSDDDVSYSNFC